MVDWKITVGDPDWDIKTPSTDAGDAQQLLRGKRHRTTICQIHLKSQGLAAMQMHWLGGGKLRALEVLETCAAKLFLLMIILPLLLHSMPHGSHIGI